MVSKKKKGFFDHERAKKTHERYKELLKSFEEFGIGSEKAGEIIYHVAKDITRFSREYDIAEENTYKVFHRVSRFLSS